MLEDKSNPDFLNQLEILSKQEQYVLTIADKQKDVDKLKKKVSELQVQEKSLLEMLYTK
jgi:hypothetical protein